MRKLLFFALALWLFGALLLGARGADPTVRARAAIALANIPPIEKLVSPYAPESCGCTSPADCTCKPGACNCPGCVVGFATYEQGWRESVGTGKPLAVFVNVKPIPMKGFVTCAVDSFPGCSEPSVVIGCRSDEGKGLDRVAQFYGSITEDRARSAVDSWNLKKLQRTFVQQAPPQPSFIPVRSFGGGFSANSCRGGS